MPYQFRLSEEIARWAFEMRVASLSDWRIAFANPTAGPWKRLMGLDEAGIEAEVHRFRREEDRPDLVLVNDDLCAVVIVEAKDTLRALMTPAQVRKSCAVVRTLAGTLGSLVEHVAWGHRAAYTVVPGLLWGALERTSTSASETAFAIYSAALVELGFAAPGCIGVEVLRTGQDLEVQVLADAAGARSSLVSEIVRSLTG